MRKEISVIRLKKQNLLKKKFEHINALYRKLLDRRKIVEDMYELIGASSIIEIRKSYDTQTELDRQLQNDIAMAGLYMDEAAIKEIRNFMNYCYLIMINVMSIGEDRLSKIPSQQPYLIYKVVGGDNFDLKIASEKVHEMSAAMNNTLTKITTMLKNYLSIK